MDKVLNCNIIWKSKRPEKAQMSTNRNQLNKLWYNHVMWYYAVIKGNGKYFTKLLQRNLKDILVLLSETKTR